MNNPEPDPPPSCDQTHLSDTIILLLPAFFLLAFTVYLHFDHPGQDMEISVSSASLCKFSFNSSSPGGERFLTYNLSTNLTFRNCNYCTSGISYDRLEANVDYDGVRFGGASLAVFDQTCEEVREVVVEFDGVTGFVGGGDNVTKIVEMDLWVSGEFRLKRGMLEVGPTYDLSAVCPLKLSVGKVGGNFTHCNVSIS